MEDGLVVKAVHHGHRESSAYSFGSYRTQRSSNKCHRLWRWSSKGCLSLTHGSLCMFTQVSWETEHLPGDRGLWVSRIVLKRWFCKGHSLMTMGKPLYIHCGGLPGDRAHWVNMIGLLSRWSYKWHSLQTQESFCMLMHISQKTGLTIPQT